MAQYGSEPGAVARQVSNPSDKEGDARSRPVGSELEAVDFEMALDVEEQARISLNNKRTADGECKNEFIIFEDPYCVDDLELDVSTSDGWEGARLALQATLSTPLPEPSMVEDDLDGDIHNDKDFTTNKPAHNLSHETLSRQEEKSPETNRYHHPAIAPYNKSPARPSPHRHHHRNTSLTSITSTTSNSSSNIFSLRVPRFKYKSPYLGPVAWTVPPRNTSQVPKPFLIYQDPSWLEQPDLTIDPIEYVAASDDKENYPYNNNFVPAGGNAATTITEDGVQPDPTEDDHQIDGTQAAAAAAVGDPHPPGYEYRWVQENIVASAENIVELASRRRSSTSSSTATTDASNQYRHRERRQSLTRRRRTHHHPQPPPSGDLDTEFEFSVGIRDDASIRRPPTRPRRDSRSIVLFRGQSGGSGQYS